MRRSPRMGGGGQFIRAVRRAVGSSSGGPGDALRGAIMSGGRTIRVPSPPPPPSVSSTSGPTSPSLRWGSRPFVVDGEEWEAVGLDAGAAAAVEVAEAEQDRLVFGPVPSTAEVEDIVSGIQQFGMLVPFEFYDVMEDNAPFVNRDMANMEVASSASSTDKASCEPKADWVEPVMQVYSSNSTLSKEHQRVLDAFHLLQVNPSVQRMVISLSSDKAVWDAVLNNVVVQEIKNSFSESRDDETKHQKSHPLDVAGALRWIFGSTKARIMEFIDTMGKMFNELLFPQKDAGDDKSLKFFNEAVQSSFMLSVVVLLIVVVSRTGHRV